MSYRHILLHLDAGAACTLRINATLDLASRIDAHVTGLATVSVAPLYYYPENAMAGQIVAEWQSQLEQQARTVTARFEAAARAHGYTSVETRIDNYNELGSLTLNARYADLVVIGQTDPAAREVSRITAADVVLACPRPVLVIPYTGAPSGFGRHALIAWNGSREACRAVTDALPLLKRAERVTVMAVDPEISAQAHGPEPGADLAKFLARHGINTEAHPDYGEVDDTGAELLSRAADLQADLLVMGAYGHTRAHEWVFGGVTRTILNSMTIPVLMAH